MDSRWFWMIALFLVACGGTNEGGSLFDDVPDGEDAATEQESAQSQADAANTRARPRKTGELNGGESERATDAGAGGEAGEAGSVPAGSGGMRPGASSGGAPVDAGSSTVERDAEPRSEPCELDMVLMIDRSGSMVGFGSQTGVDLWSPIGRALGDFAARSDIAATNASVQFFPQPLDAQPIIDDRPCPVDQYANPAAPMGPLPSNARAIQNAIVANQPQTGGTPTRPAMEGAVQYAQTIAQQNPTHKVIVVLATDGEPNDCDSTLHSVSAIAADALQAGIETYVISIGNVNGLDQIADAGGTREAYIVDADPVTAEAEFFATLGVIRVREACD